MARMVESLEITIKTVAEKRPPAIVQAQAGTHKDGNRLRVEGAASQAATSKLPSNRAAQDTPRLTKS